MRKRVRGSPVISKWITELCAPFVDFGCCMFGFPGLELAACQNLHGRCRERISGIHAGYARALLLEGRSETPLALADPAGRFFCGRDCDSLAPYAFARALA